LYASANLLQKCNKFLFNIDPRHEFKSTSDIWKDFHEVCDERNRSPHVSCKRCGALLQHPRALQGGPTSSLHKHVSATCRYRDRTPGNAVVVKTIPMQMIKTTFTIKEIEDLILKFFVSCNVPFAQAENPFFRKLIGMIKTGMGMAKCHSRFTIRRRLKDGAEIALIDTFDHLAQQDGKVSLALDCWSTRRMLPYLGTPSLLRRNVLLSSQKSFSHVTILI
jgi:hypothetical protein